MARNLQEWKRLAETYRMAEDLGVSIQQGKRTLPQQIRHKISRLKYQFLPHYAGVVPRWRLKLRARGGERVLPDFACIGVMKGGSSDLATYLLQHPAILPPLSKEISTTNAAQWKLYYPTVQEMEQVKKEHGKARCGYFRPIIHNIQILDGMYACNPEAKIVLMLRNPIDRAFSQYKWELLYGGRMLTSAFYFKTFANYIDTALDLFPTMSVPTRFAMPVLSTGIYVKAVEKWLDRFGRENVYIVRAEDFFKDLPAVVCCVHEFLDLPPIKPEFHGIINKNPMKAPPFEEETRDKLREFYRPWNEQLYTLLGRDMEWK